MTPPSSIFSFSTLRVRPWLPKSLLLAIVLMAVAEKVVRFALATHRLDMDPSARRLIEGNRAAIANQKPKIWLLGNSTLEWGVDDSILAQNLRIGSGRPSYVKLLHGSATASASATMLDFYLKSAPKMPTEIILFLSKDDVNRNGSRAEISKSYTALAAQPIRTPQEYLMLWQARAHIVEKLQLDVERLLPNRFSTNTTVPVKRNPYFDGIIAPDEDHYVGLVKNFSLDHDGIRDFAAAAHSRGITNLKIVLMPCTDSYVRFHNMHFPAESYDRIRSEIRLMCVDAGVSFLDFGDPQTTYSEFRDGYHLNPRGAARFTHELLDEDVFQADKNATK